MIRNKVKNREAKTKLYLCFSVVLVITLAISACEGPTGPQGPRGDAGAQGIQGEQGPQGEEGTANVVYSEWLDVEWNGADESDYKRMDIIEPLITPEFMETGTALMYLLHSQGHVSALPFTAIPFASGLGQTYAFFMRPEGFTYPVPGPFPEEEGLSFYIQRAGGVGSGGIEKIRYILIPGGVPAKIPDPDRFFEDYNAVKEHYGIPG